MAKAFPGTDIDERHRIAVGYFARAMGSSLRQHTLASRPKSLAEALQTALAYENACRLDEMEDRKVKAVDRSGRIRTMGVGPDGEDQSSAMFVTQWNGANHGRQANVTTQPASRIVCQLCGKSGQGAKGC